MGYIYKITNNINNKVYIGQTRRRKPNSRLAEHKYKALHNTEGKLYEDIRIYGYDKFKLDVLEENVAGNELDELERYYIDLYKSTNNNFGYNSDSGGLKNFKRLKESIEKTAKKNKGRTLSEETKKKLSLASKGRKHSEETKNKISEANKGRTLTEEQKEKCRLANIGRHPSEETKKKLSDAHKGEKNYWYGKKLPEQARKHMSENQWLNRSIGKINKDTNEIVEQYRSLSEAARQNNVTHKAIVGRIERHSIMDNCYFIYLEESKKKSLKVQSI